MKSGGIFKNKPKMDMIKGISNRFRKIRDLFRLTKKKINNEAEDIAALTNFTFTGYVEAEFHVSEFYKSGASRDFKYVMVSETGLGLISMLDSIIKYHREKTKDEIRDEEIWCYAAGSFDILRDITKEEYLTRKESEL